MAISFNTGATTSTGAPLVASVAITIPAGVLAGDVVFVMFNGFAAASDTVEVASTGTAPTRIGTSQSVAFSANTDNASLFYFVAAASDAGKVITGSFLSGGTAQWAAALAAWSGASGVSPIDVSGAVTASGASSTVTCPSRTTTVSGDWDLQIIGAALGGSSYTGPAGFTQRESVSDANSGSSAAFYDSNGSVGGSGTNIGGGTFSNAGNNSWWAGFTVGLAPPISASTPVTAHPPAFYPSGAQPAGALNGPAPWFYPL